MRHFSNQSSALAWECWRRCRLEIFSHILLIALIGLILWWLTNSIDQMDRPLLTEAFAILACGFGLFSFAVVRDNPSTGFSFSQNFVKPVPTRTLVLVPLAVIWLKSLLMTMLSLSVIQMASGIHLSVANYIFAIIVLVTLTVSISWSVTGLLGRILVGASIFLILLAIVWWRIANLQGLLWYRPAEFSGAVMPVIWMLGIVVLLVAPQITIRQVVRQRHQWVSDQAKVYFPIRVSPIAKPKPIWLTDQFSSSFNALVWYELKKVGLSVISGVIAINLLILALGIFGKILNPYARLPAETLQTQIFGAIVFNSMIVAFLGSLMALDAKSSGIGIRSFHFSSSRPVSDGQLIYSKLTAILVLLVVSFGISGLGLFLSATLLGIGLTDLIAEPSWLQELWMKHGWMGLGMIVFLGFMKFLMLGALVFSLLVYSMRFGLFVFSGLMILLVIFFRMGLDSDQGWLHYDFWVWLWIRIILVLAAFALIASAGSMMRKKTTQLPAMFIVGCWLVLLMALTALGLMTLENGISDIPRQTLALIVAGSWIAPGLTLSIPAVYGLLRHR